MRRRFATPVRTAVRVPQGARLRPAALPMLLLAASIACFAPRVQAQEPVAPAAEPAAWAACDAAFTAVERDAAQTPVDRDAALATFCAGVRTERTMQALSRRYRDVWARLSADQRSAFSAAERRWLSIDRYRERDACVAHHAKSAVVHPELVAAECLGEVTARRLAQVDARFAATQRAVAQR